MQFELVNAPIDPSVWQNKLRSYSAGGFCAYEGWVRDHNEGKPVAALHYSAYPELAPSVAGQILNEARDRFAIESAAAVHRMGRLTAGEIAVWVGVTAHHRDATFLACRYIIDNIKYRLPIWKKEIYTDGTTAWIENHQCNCAHPANLAPKPSEK